MQALKETRYLKINNNIEREEKSINRKRGLLLTDKEDNPLGHIIIMHLYGPNDIASKSGKQKL